MHLKSKLDAGKFAVLAEIIPPKGTDVTAMVANATKVKGVVDAFVIPEMTSAVMRMSSLGGALILQGKGLETVMQVCCRDRNRLSLQADLLAANRCGVRNIMAVTGEDPSFGDHHEAKAVYDIDLFELLQGIKDLQTGKDMAGIDLVGSPQFLTGSSINTGAQGDALKAEIDDMNKKIEAGVDFFITPPVFDLTAIEPFLEKVDHQKIHIIPTVLLLKSLGMARYMARNVAHVHIPDELITRIQKAGDKVRECILIASETIETFKKKGFCGVHIATIGWEGKLPEILGTMGG